MTGAIAMRECECKRSYIDSGETECVLCQMEHSEGMIDCVVSNSTGRILMYDLHREPRMESICEGCDQVSYHKLSHAEFVRRLKEQGRVHPD